MQWRIQGRGLGPLFLDQTEARRAEKILWETAPPLPTPPLTGRLTLIINIYKNILYYILYLLRKNEDTVVKQAFRTSLELHCNGKNSFYHNLMKISEYYDLPDFDPNNLSEANIKHYIDIIKQKYITYWQHTIHHSKKLQLNYLNMIIKFQVI